MESEQLFGYCRDVARLASKSKGHYGNLVFPQRRSGRPVIREPEMRDVFGRYLMLELVMYGIEVPTKEKYCFKGKSATSARTDLAIFDSLSAADRNAPIVNIEFKEGQPVTSQLEKDWQKLLREPVDGACFYHVLQNSYRTTMEVLVDKYDTAYSEALAKVASEARDKWFLFFAVTIDKQEYYWESCRSILAISFDQLRELAPAKL